MVKTMDAIRTARSLIGTPYSTLDCIGLIVRVIRTSPGGVGAYRTAGTNTLWRSAEASAKYVEPAVPEAPKITIIDSANNHFSPVGDFRVIIGSVD